MDVLKETAEQILHMVWAFTPIVLFWLVLRRPAWGWRAVVGGAVVGFVFALPRELVDQWPINRPWDTVLDLCFFAIGGAFGGLLGWRVK